MTIARFAIHVLIPIGGLAITSASSFCYLSAMSKETQRSREVL